MSFKNRVFLGKLPHDTRKRDIERWLEDYGFKHIENVQLKPGYAFVDFRHVRDADHCVKDLDRRDFMGARISVELARGPKHRSRSRSDEHRHESRGRFTYRNGYYRDKYGAPYNTEWRLIVQNISSRVGWQEIKDFFRQTGNVTYAECHRQRTGEGAVEFSSREDMKRALEKLDGEEFMGRRIKLTEIFPEDSAKGESKRDRPSSRDKDSRRRRSSSRSHSRGRTKSKSRSRSASFA
ncbi:hypothetical protein HZS_326 [Henneguya salminicola]|nr:hypothetical protein HZS_326 [Henneguya salminicola]